jgi:hypothetical protein
MTSGKPENYITVQGCTFISACILDCIEIPAATDVCEVQQLDDAVADNVKSMRKLELQNGG